jgi:hypothetical protein
MELASSALSPSVNRPWWQQRWVGAFLVLGVILGVFIVLTFPVIRGVLVHKQSRALYHTALVQAGAHPGVIAALGSPISSGSIANTIISITDSNELWRFDFPVTGPKGQGTVRLEAIRTQGGHYFKSMVMEVTGTTNRIDIITPVSP